MSGVTSPCSARNSATRQVTVASSSLAAERRGMKMAGSNFQVTPPSTGRSDVAATWAMTQGS